VERGVSELTKDRLLELLRDPACPFAAQLRAGADTRVIALSDLTAFVASRTGAVDGLEARLDRLMTDDVGAERFGLVDPWSAPRRLLHRLRGGHNPPQVAYEVRASVIRAPGHD
jgi:hypothetical protein